MFVDSLPLSLSLSLSLSLIMGFFFYYFDKERLFCTPVPDVYLCFGSVVFTLICFTRWKRNKSTLFAKVCNYM